MPTRKRMRARRTQMTPTQKPTQLQMRMCTRPVRKTLIRKQMQSPTTNTLPVRQTQILTRTEMRTKMQTATPTQKLWVWVTTE